MLVVMLGIPIILLLAPVLARPRMVLQIYSTLAGLFFATMWGMHFWESSRPGFHDGAGSGFGLLIFIYWTAAFVAGFGLRLITDALAVVVVGAIGPEARKRRRRISAKAKARQRSDVLAKVNSGR